MPSPSAMKRRGLANARSSPLTMLAPRRMPASQSRGAAFAGAIGSDRERGVVDRAGDARREERRDLRKLDAREREDDRVEEAGGATRDSDEHDRRGDRARPPGHLGEPDRGDRDERGEREGADRPARQEVHRKAAEERPPDRLARASDHGPGGRGEDDQIWTRTGDDDERHDRPL